MWVDCSLTLNNEGSYTEDKYSKYVLWSNQKLWFVSKQIIWLIFTMAIVQHALALYIARTKMYFTTVSSLQTVHNGLPHSQKQKANLYSIKLLYFLSFSIHLEWLNGLVVITCNGSILYNIHEGSQTDYMSVYSGQKDYICHKWSDYYPIL